jgi:hypothetical protein
MNLGPATKLNFFQLAMPFEIFWYIFTIRLFWALVLALFAPKGLQQVP